MILMQMNGLSKSFGSETILSNVKLEVKDLDRIAIVGRNGAGKSTLLKIMAGDLSYDTGELIKPKELTIGYLSQHMELQSGKTIWNELVTVFDDLKKQEGKLRHIEEQLQTTDLLSEADYQNLLTEYDRLQHAFETGGGYTYEAEIKAVLHGLNFQDYDYNTMISELSGGQKTRLALGKLLLQKPQLLLLDEPTNHLDIETLGWLESYLNSYPGAIVIVSHDRYFLDKTVTLVYEISRHQTKKYHGTYSKFLEQKAADYERERKEFEKQQTEIKRMEDFVQRNIARASTTKRAQSRRKQLERMERMDRPLGDEASMSFSFDIERRSGNDVLKIEDLALRYPDEEEYTFKQANLRITRGERVVLIGPNGVGKTSLLKILIGKLQATKGIFELGTNVKVGYYDQEQADLSSNKTILQELWDEYPLVMEKDIRTVLGNFLFSGDDVLKPVNTLSGGEKARLALAKLMMQKANLLILDEPTNHLDIDSKEVLEAALMGYPGTILFVSHDRYFINRITDQVAQMSKDGIKIYLGDYDYYLEKTEEEKEFIRLSQQKEDKPNTDNRRRSFQEEKQLQSEKRKRDRKIAQLETAIEEKELEIANLEEEMTKPEVFQDHEKALELTKQVNELNDKLEELMESWANLQD
ncbi:ABC-F family ATP-binding cassette domain-containing protein [Oceanobacillus alkalisoli]|uniref:ABC-F family ATP-binding cassette domain-containing protein n=1 Tax=Oceanobacillus alkalisoli TaxID=2925113 RepID=UPI001EF01426|nr:ABC-F family ATP-binding cassette domain-containing protein [Oceanobacillus alkalisoli]MCF3943170.1 ABC-F family ATP-binding cassette domain-containing protein [Oceanobacillus alkalisoli]MCG5105353.1 ABC-F family ATP-binding cassette domain-containing protein [Oceanobacillus alkalisoli]